MSNSERSAVRYQFSESIDILAAFESLRIEHLEVSDERTIVIYSRTVFNVEVPDGQLHDTQTVDVEVFDISSDLDTDADSVPLIESLIEEIATTANVNWKRR